MKLKKISYILLFFVYFFNVIDLIITFFGISRFGISAESNTILIFLIEKFGFEIMGIFKIISIIIYSIPLIILIRKTNGKMIYIVIFSLYFINYCYIVIIIEWLSVLI